MLAEFLLVELDQPAAMLAFLAGHFGEHVGAGRIVLAQALGDVGVDTAVLFLIGDRQGEDFAFGEIGEIAHGSNLAGERPQSSERRNDANASQQQAQPDTAASTAAPSRSTIVSISAAVAMYGGATMTWSPCLPSIVPPIG